MTKREWSQGELLQMLDFMADKLAVAGMALAALDEAVDPLDREGWTDHWGMVTLLAQAQAEMFAPLPSPFPVQADASRWLEAARKNRKPELRDMECFEVVKGEIRKCMSAQFRKSRAA